MLSTDSWRKVKIIDLFDIKSGVRLTKKDWGDPIYSYIGSSAVNNGITGMCDRYNYENILAINYDGSVGYTFWHPYKLFLSDACKALIPKFKINNNLGIFLSTVLTRTFVGNYNYGKKLTTSRLQQESIYLPFKNNQIDWEWIEEFMRDLDSNLVKVNYNYSNDLINTDSWKKFKITDLFNIQGGSTLTKDNWGDPLYPYIGASATDNGQTGKCDQWNYENSVSINSTGSVGYAFWHPYKFFLSSNCRVLIPKFDITDNIGVFISTILTKSFVGNYNYGKNLTTVRLQGEFIYLPEKDGEPDWEYMESFISDLIQQ